MNTCAKIKATGEIKTFYPTRECGYDGYVDTDGKFYYPTELDFRNGGEVSNAKNPDCVTYEQAVALKRMGFCRECDYYYHDKELITIDSQAQVNRNINGWGRDNKFSAPRIDQAHEWLISKGYFIAVEWHSKTIWKYGIYKDARPAFFNNTMKPSYKEIMLSAITEALNLIERNEI